MAPWTLSSSSTLPGRTFTRPLGLNELGFYYDACFFLIADVYFCCEIETKGPHGDDLFHYDNVANAWIAVKQRYPLLGAKIGGQFGSDDVHFVVSEKKLAELTPGELFFDSVSSEEDVSRLIEETVRGPPRNFHDLMNRLFIIRRLDKPNRWNVIFNFHHCTNDGSASANTCCKFFDILALRITPLVPDIAQRLETILPAEDLNPTKKMKLPHQRWRRAIAYVLWNIRDSRLQVYFMFMHFESLSIEDYPLHRAVILFLAR